MLRGEHVFSNQAGQFERNHKACKVLKALKIEKLYNQTKHPSVSDTETALFAAEKCSIKIDCFWCFKLDSRVLILILIVFPLRRQVIK